MEVDNSDNKSTTRKSEVQQGSSNNNIALLACIRTTQSQLGKHISRPPLLLKYLVQPPFLFFHDIITSYLFFAYLHLVRGLTPDPNGAFSSREFTPSVYETTAAARVINTKGFLRGLFSADELDRMKAQCLKENRIHFFDKLIRALHATTGERFPKFNLAKMSTGRHPLSVNRLLHCIAYSLDMNMNSDLAVKKINDELDLELYCRGGKRKLSDCTIEDDYFGDDESESQQINRKAQTKKTNRKEISTMNPAENDDAFSMAYENDLASVNQNGTLTLQDNNYKVVRALSNLSIYDDSDNKMEIA